MHPSSHRFTLAHRWRARQWGHSLHSKDPEEAQQLAAPSTETQRSMSKSPGQTKQPKLEHTLHHLPQWDQCLPYRTAVMWDTPRGSCTAACNPMSSPPWNHSRNFKSWFFLYCYHKTDNTILRCNLREEWSTKGSSQRANISEHRHFIAYHFY